MHPPSPKLKRMTALCLLFLLPYSFGSVWEHQHPSFGSASPEKDCKDLGLYSMTISKPPIRLCKSTGYGHYLPLPSKPAMPEIVSHHHINVSVTVFRRKLTAAVAPARLCTAINITTSCFTNFVGQNSIVEMKFPHATELRWCSPDNNPLFRELDKGGWEFDPTGPQAYCYWMSTQYISRVIRYQYKSNILIDEFGYISAPEKLPNPCHYSAGHCETQSGGQLVWTVNDTLLNSALCALEVWKEERCQVLVDTKSALHINCPIAQEVYVLSKELVFKNNCTKLLYRSRGNDILAIEPSIEYILNVTAESQKLLQAPKTAVPAIDNINARLNFAIDQVNEQLISLERRVYLERYKNELWQYHWLLELSRSYPNLAIRHLLKSDFYFGHYMENGFQVWPCVPVTQYSFLANLNNSLYWPISFIVSNNVMQGCVSGQGDVYTGNQCLTQKAEPIAFRFQFGQIVIELFGDLCKIQTAEKPVILDLNGHLADFSGQPLYTPEELTNGKSVQELRIKLDHLAKKVERYEYPDQEGRTDGIRRNFVQPISNLHSSDSILSNWMPSWLSIFTRDWSVLWSLLVPLLLIIVFLKIKVIQSLQDIYYHARERRQNLAMELIPRSSNRQNASFAHI